MAVKKAIPVAVERKSGTCRHGRRRPRIDPTTCERNYTPEDIEFMKAMDQYKRDNKRFFPEWWEVLEVARALGYRKVIDPVPLPGEVI